MKNIKLISHPLIEHKLSFLRDKNTDPFQFRLLVDEITYLMLFEACSDFELKDTTIKTPICETKSKKLKTKVTICPILRAALGMLDGVFRLIPDASVGFLGFQRNEKTLQAEFYYSKLPKDVEKNIVIIIDPMFATGSTAISAVKHLKEQGVKDIKFISLIAAPQGIEKFSKIYPDVDVYLAAIDEKLNEKGYIVPGLGDAGDRIFNTL
ncbi:uracil phosphoribosyltransferase [Campylobacter sp. RM12327]|uniref:Uracil phosphoribosyltransferase n=1 Tax=Campylobacter sputorum subsp. sputorum TaxID=32024 RepID=A0A381F335_9BACT|nr:MULTISPECIES: uracil phosphoribosyltransferase [Campylobacter]ASM35090.1 uracil phosphoribosyltransferase [Campylobacter sputorum aubsp. sputorum RM3237]ASM36756.1 uracil phosphoribosyltransferase [Campylobacter sputorum bv. faecalis CCUG 20703]ASM38444.1 uracil phosphoribosyltransferase [Campylobacter sputorum bv. paraureolyticus LMG 11764]ASM40036.1 uracil phosphoribosyltransferase [Campylobacter sputorum]KAB0581309.1 uracil phosphoribosyltransferase [Campylobacter sputorum subsp. sputoru